jgi:hypothetical protein
MKISLNNGTPTLLMWNKIIGNKLTDPMDAIPTSAPLKPNLLVADPEGRWES